MKARGMITLLAVFTIGGAIFGFAEASGIRSAFDSSHRRRQGWEPITREEYRRRLNTYCLYGSAIGFAVGVVFVAHRVTTGGMSKPESEPDT